ncbi:MAG: YiiX/YebB-like N1pC/P60 family cysteine hydrolase [Gemmatimonadaceae bacterium]|nr:YiiX/YebB-like N1pC/P60 family cysteine hydrolase [Gemmatimonadaceae bacterium]
MPAPDAAVPAAPANGTSFAWNRDSVWRGLEARFVAARATGCADSLQTSSEIRALDSLLTHLSATSRGAEDAAFDSLEAGFFVAAPRVAACGSLVPRYVRVFTRMREMVKAQSARWDVNAAPARERLYRTLYGGRAAVEEVMLQQPSAVQRLVLGTNTDSVARSVTPSAVSNGVTLHSGDLLVSRGGFPTSALIARGNDYPGNFSHIALVHVDADTRAISVIEAHIEAGVAVSSADAYLADKKLRVMVLRPRADLPSMQRNPMLPHLAATAMLTRARSQHIPYDFAMDYTDPSRLFCSEVASSAYRTQGLELWMGISTISRDGLRRWLSAFGVQHFATQEPSDLEYDPQVHVVAEWHDAATLFSDHVDNAVTDAMLEEADQGATLDYDWYTLPVARVMKAYSWVRVQMGSSGPIPEGMSAGAALRNRRYGERHAARAAELRRQAGEWQEAHGYPPAYWTLVDLARRGNGATKQATGA